MSHENARFRARYWPVLIARAAIAAVATLVITFSSDHSPVFGLLVFAGYALATGVVTSIWRARAGSSRSVAAQTLTSGVVTAVVGAATLIAALVAPSLGALVIGIAVWGAVNGVLEITLGLRGDVTSIARDRFIVGGMTVVIAVLVLLGAGDSVFVVGAFGAYAAVTAVYLAIAAFSLKWESANAEPQRSVTES